MRGFPKYINTREDLENVKVNFPAETRAWMQDVYDHREQWIIVGKLDADEPGINIDGKFKVVENKDVQTGEITERYQYEFKEDPNGTIFRLGFASSAEFKQFIADI